MCSSQRGELTIRSWEVKGLMVDDYRVGSFLEFEPNSELSYMMVGIPCQFSAHGGKWIFHKSFEFKLCRTDNSVLLQTFSGKRKRKTISTKLLKHATSDFSPFDFWARFLKGLVTKPNENNFKTLIFSTVAISEDIQEVT